MSDAMVEVRDRLLRGEYVKVKLPNGIGGIVYVDKDYYPDESMFMIAIDEGWAYGITEAICEVGQTFLEDQYLVDAKVYVDAGASWSQIQ